jgi:hypothetical protein
VPSVLAVTIPTRSTEATEGLPLLHVPPLIALVSVVADPKQISCELPVIAGGVGLMLTLSIFLHPPGSRYVIVAVPTFKPVNTPVVAFIGDVAILLLLQVPPLAVLPSVTVVPTQSTDGPVIAGAVVIVIPAVA